MNHRILGRGAIACSAVVVTQWIPSFAIQLPAGVCRKETALEPTSPPTTSTQITQSQKCSFNSMLSLMESLPERFKQQWSQSDSPQLPRSIEREYQQIVEQAQTLASHNQVAEAIALVTAIPKNTRYSDLAYQLQETWSQEMLHQATSHYQQADLSTALKLLEAIPAISSQHPQAIQLKRKWQQDATQLQRAVAASKAGAWQDVVQRLETFKDTPLFHSLPIQELWQIAMTKMLEPDATLLQIASITDSTSSLGASLPSSPSYLISSSSRPSPPPLPSTSSSFNVDLDRALARPTTLSQVAKLDRSDRQAVTAHSAPSKQDGSSAKIRQFSSSPSTPPTVDKLKATSDR